MMIFRDYRCEEKNKDDDDDKEELVVLGQKGKWGLALRSVGGAASSTALLFFGMPRNKKPEIHFEKIKNKKYILQERKESYLQTTPLFRA